MFKLLLIQIVLMTGMPALAQKNGKYTSISEALQEPLAVVELQLSGIREKLPEEISKFKNLETVRLINLSGEYDLNDAFIKLAGLRSVKKLYLYGNGHRDLPKSISKIESLEFVELNGSLKNSLSSIIKSLSGIENFNSLSLRSMDLVEIPGNIISLNLKHLNLGNNPNLDYKKAFELLSKFKLESLDLSSGKFTVVPKDITKLSSLKRLDLELIDGKFNNEASFSILAELPNLEELNIQGNFFGELDESIQKLAHLKLLEIDGNCIVEERYEKLKKLLPNTIIQNEIPC